MKRLYALILSLVLALGVLASPINPPKGFAGQLWNGTFALYGTKDSTTHFLCTAEAIHKNDGGYTLLSAGHCVTLNPPDVQFAVAETIGGTLVPVTLIKAARVDNIDFSLFNLQTTKKYFVMDMGFGEPVTVGDETINPNFALGLGKQISLGRVSSLGLEKSEECDDPACIGNFQVQEYAAPGASGSAILSTKAHKIIGVLVLEWQGAQVGFSVEPIDRFKDFLALKAPPAPPSNDTLGLRIPETEFQRLFGETHTFTLTVHGPNPRFVQAGWTFVIDTDGFELSDDYYYNVPVFIDENEDGTYRLTSTRDGVGVDAIVAQGPKA